MKRTFHHNSVTAIFLMCVFVPIAVGIFIAFCASGFNIILIPMVILSALFAILSIWSFFYYRKKEKEEDRRN